MNLQARKEYVKGLENINTCEIARDFAGGIVPAPQGRKRDSRREILTWYAPNPQHLVLCQHDTQ